MPLNCGVGEDSWESLGQQRDHQSILKEISPEYSLEGLMLKFKLQYFGHLMRRADSLEKTLMLRKIEGRRGRGWQKMRWLDDIINSIDRSLRKFQRQWRTGKPGVLQSMGLQRVGHNWAIEQQQHSCNIQTHVFTTTYSLIIFVCKSPNLLSNSGRYIGFPRLAIPFLYLCPFYLYFYLIFSI